MNHANSIDSLMIEHATKQHSLYFCPLNKNRRMNSASSSFHIVLVVDFCCFGLFL